MRPARTLCLLVICSLLSAGCSAIGFAYNNAPSWIAGELQEAFDLDDAQRLELDTRMQEFFIWHREQELDRYRQILDDAARNVLDGITATEFLEFVDALRLALRRLLEQAIVSFGDLGLTLTPEQIDHYERYFSEKSDEYRDYLELSSQQREIYRTEQAIERMQKWFGSLDENQLQKLRPLLRELPDLYQAWIEFRDARQQALVTALREASSAGLSHRQLKTILLGPETDYARAFEVERTAYWQAYAQIVEEVSGWLGRTQLRRAIERLQKYSLAFEDIGNENRS